MSQDGKATTTPAPSASVSSHFTRDDHAEEVRPRIVPASSTGHPTSEILACRGEQDERGKDVPWHFSIQHGRRDGNERPRREEEAIMSLEDVAIPYGRSETLT